MGRGVAPPSLLMQTMVFTTEFRCSSAHQASVRQRRAVFPDSFGAFAYMLTISQPYSVPRPAPATRRHVVRAHPRMHRDNPRGRRPTRPARSRARGLQRVLATTGTRCAPKKSRPRSASHSTPRLASACHVQRSAPPAWKPEGIDHDNVDIFGSLCNAFVQHCPTFFLHSRKNTCNDLIVVH